MQAYYSINGQKTVSDLCLFLYGSLDYIGKLIRENNFITGINFDLSTFGGVKVLYDNSIAQLVPPNLKVSPSPVIIHGIYTVKQGQGLSDLALHTYFGIDNLITLLIDNNLDSINLMPDELLGLNLKFNPTLTKSPVIQNHNKNNNIVYATGFSFNRDSEIFRLLEDGNYRLLEDGSYRLLE